MGVGVVVRGDIQLRCSAGHHAGGRLRAVALKVFIGDVQRGGGDCQVVVAVPGDFDRRHGGNLRRGRYA